MSSCLCWFCQSVYIAVWEPGELHNIMLCTPQPLRGSLYPMDVGLIYVTSLCVPCTPDPLNIDVEMMNGDPLTRTTPIPSGSTIEGNRGALDLAIQQATMDVFQN